MEINKDWFKDSIGKQYKDQGSKMQNNFANIIFDGIKNKSEYISEVGKSDLEDGKFYFIYYDLKSNTSDMDKFIPVLYLGKYVYNNIPYSICLNLNFIPIVIRVELFNKIINSSLNIIEKNNKKSIDNEEPLNDISYDTVFGLLNDNFHFAIRPYRTISLDKIFNISTNLCQEFICMDSYRFTGVADDKLINIYNKQLIESKREKLNILSRMERDFKKYQKDLEKNIYNLEKQEANLLKSINTIKKL